MILLPTKDLSISRVLLRLALGRLGMLPTFEVVVPVEVEVKEALEESKGRWGVEADETMLMLGLGGLARVGKE